MASEEVLRKTLKNADGKPFVKYKGITNNFVLDDFEIIIDEVQNDRAGHTRMRVRVPMKAAGFPEDTWSTKVREVALRDLIARRFWESARTHARSPIPKTDGGEVYIPRPGQEILERGSVIITRYFVEVRFTADLPSVGGKVCAATTEALIFSRIRTIVSESMFYSAYKQSKLYNHIQTAENAEFIRGSLESRGLVGFVAVGSILPRRDDDLAPMVGAEPFDCDDSLKVTFDVPNGDPIVGMGIPRGFTVLTGPSRSGKTVLADSIFAGVYNHIPGDGREYVISLPESSFVMSEGGRPSDSVDISMFVSSISEFDDTHRALGQSVSAPMSELVAISESIEMGCRFIIIDEEFSCPGVIRRGFLADDDPINPLSEMGRSMAGAGVSLLMISGDESAARSSDRVISVRGFHASSADVEYIVPDSDYSLPAERFPVSKGIVYEKARKEVSINAVAIRTIEIGEYKVNVPVAALFDMAQTRMLADAAVVMKDLMDGSRSMYDACREAIDIVMENDLSSENGDGMHHATIRPIDLAAVMNRHPQMLAIQKRE